MGTGICDGVSFLRRGAGITGCGDGERDRGGVDDIGAGGLAKRVECGGAVDTAGVSNGPKEQPLSSATCDVLSFSNAVTVPLIAVAVAGVACVGVDAGVDAAGVFLNMLLIQPQASELAGAGDGAAETAAVAGAELPFWDSVVAAVGIVGDDNDRRGGGTESVSETLGAEAR